MGSLKALVLFINLQGESDSAILSPHCRVLWQEGTDTHHYEAQL